MCFIVAVVCFCPCWLSSSHCHCPTVQVGATILRWRLRWPRRARGGSSEEAWRRPRPQLPLAAVPQGSLAQPAYRSKCRQFSGRDGGGQYVLPATFESAHTSGPGIHSRSLRSRECECLTKGDSALAVHESSSTIQACTDKHTHT